MNAVFATPDPTYYLSNFHKALTWLQDRYSDLLTAGEQAFIERFSQLCLPSQALLVRLIMRKPTIFRSRRIRYPEIGCVVEAAAPLIGLGWVEADPELGVTELFEVFNREEIAAGLGMKRTLTKASLLESAVARQLGQCRASSWCRDEVIYRVLIAPLCVRLRLLFFGNFQQDWKEFVLADLGIFKYERVELDRQSRAFQTREDIDNFFTLYECRQRFHDEQPLEEVLTQLPQQPLRNEWLEGRRAKLLFQVAQEYERLGLFDVALPLYRRSTHQGARLRAVRVLEKAAHFEAAFELAQQASLAAQSEAEAQKLPRVIGRLRRRLGLDPQRLPKTTAPERIDLCMPEGEQSVEHSVADHLTRDEAPVRYVENSLINSLFGLLCWDAVFAPVSGAFFHPFHAAPADLFSDSFHTRRRDVFDRCLDSLHGVAYVDRIRAAFKAKTGTHSPFVSWGLLDDQLLDTALACIPPQHLRLYFLRLLANLRENCTGLPDLIQFWPAERRYRLIEVKGPGDRLQDNQRRWLDYCRTHEIPVAVCYVRWAQAT